MIYQFQLAKAFFMRDLLISLSYKTSFALELLGALVQVFLLFFLSRLLLGTTEPSLMQYGNDYFGFVVVGVALSMFMALGLTGLSTRVREGQMMGTLEFMVLSPSRLPLLLVYSSVWHHVYSAGTLIAFWSFGVLLGFDVSRANVPMAVLGLLLSVICFNALGLVAASIVIVIKQGNPVIWVVSSASMLVAGVYYPPEVLPAALRALAQALPLTHSLEVMRHTLLNGAGMQEVWPSLLALLLLTAILAPLGVAMCNLAVRLARTDGTLAHY